MDKLRIVGGTPLRGSVVISGAKNSALPLMTAHLLTDEKVTLHNVPELADIQSMRALLENMGSTLTENKGTYTFQTNTNQSTVAAYDFVRKMRASVLVLGPLVGRYGEATLSLPGGCAIGMRPIDLHLKALEALGAAVTLENGSVKVTAKQGLRGGEYVFPIVSVTGTKNMMMAACLARGTTHIINAAREPEVTDLGTLLAAMGAKIEGLGTSTITVEGVTSLKGATYSVMADRIEAGTYAMAAGITGGELDILGGDLAALPATIEDLHQAGLEITPLKGGFRVKSGKALKSTDMITAPFPGFATDLQAQFMALMCIAQGSSVITETIFENRFMHVAELVRMGANIQVHGSSAIVKGVPRLKGAQVMATDLRASVALVLGALAAEGESLIHRIYHLDRGYEHIENKLRACGAEIERVL